MITLDFLTLSVAALLMAAPETPSAVSQNDAVAMAASSDETSDIHIKGVVFMNSASPAENISYAVLPIHQNKYNSKNVLGSREYTYVDLSASGKHKGGEELSVRLIGKNGLSVVPATDENFIFDAGSEAVAVYKVEDDGNAGCRLTFVTVLNDPSRKPYKLNDVYYPAVVEDMYDDGNCTGIKDAQKGFIEGTGLDGKIAGSFDVTKYQQAMTQEDAPSTVHPNLWRMERLNNNNGLFRVYPDGGENTLIYQIRSYDMATMSFVKLKGENNWMVIDPLGCYGTAQKAMEVFKKQEPESVVKAVLITHSHIDHYNGLAEVLKAENSEIYETESGSDFTSVPDGKMLVIAPSGFYEESISENLYLGVSMGRRASYMYGSTLPVDSLGHIGAGLGKSVGQSQGALLKPSFEVDIPANAMTKMNICGIDITLQNVPGSEAPAEFHIIIDTYRVICPGENVCKTMHNLLTPRGAKVRDPKAFASAIDGLIRYIDDNWGDEGCNVIIGTHHWPTWGKDECMNLLVKQRDLYTYFNDQVIRLINKGMNMEEIAEIFVLPKSLNNEYFNRGYYGTINHNVKAVFQRYTGWWDGNPANYYKYPEAEAARRFVADMGGEDALLNKAYDYFLKEDYRWTVELTKQLIFNNPKNIKARYLQADALEQLGYSFEAGTWRNIFLTGAQELRLTSNLISEEQSAKLALTKAKVSLTKITSRYIFEYFATLLDGFEAGDLVRTWKIRIGDEKSLVELYNGVLHYKDITDDPSEEGFITYADVTEFADDFEKTMTALINDPESVSDGLSDLYRYLDIHNLLWKIVEPLQ